MAFRIFTVPIRDPAASQDELNSFLQSHKVLSVEQHWVDRGADSFWSFCVDYHDYHASATKSASTTVRGKKSQVDYREVLNEEDFAVYSELRELRKQLAQQESVAVYVVFTNEQLAEMVQQRVATKADLERIVGAGSARIGKYGEQFLELLSKQWSSDHEASRKPK
jgi:superfamily II DNA helicase RecQ